MRDPFTVLGVDEAADDAEIRRRYLTLVRDFPPDRAPERFREYRAAYEALSDERKRLEMTLLGTNTIALSRLCTAALLAAASPGSSRASKQAVAALLAEGVMRTVTDKRPPG
jgi:DnaJ-class molecular chaperone